MAALILFFNFFNLWGFPAFAADLGTLGPVYPIQEQDLLVLIQKRLKNMQANGEIKAANVAFRKRSIARIKRPMPVSGITKAHKTKSYYFDPTITLQRTIRDHKGHVIAKKGTKINPLKTVTLHEKLLFINGDDRDQVRWALLLNKKYQENAKIILLNGSPIDLMQRYKIRFYFDQYGKISGRFGIRHVPAIAEQQGLKLRITEVKL